MEIFIIIVVLVIIWQIILAKAKARTRLAYKTSITRLKKDPTNATLRQRTLELGRIYSSLTRNNKGVTHFDEVALLNDINAACAGATTLVNNVPIPVSTPASLQDRLTRLGELKEQGLINDEEFQAKRQLVLNEA